MKRFLTILSLVGTVGALTAFAPAGQAAATVSKFPVSFTLFDPCTNENVDFTGSAVVVLNTTQDNHAVFHATDVNIRPARATASSTPSRSQSRATIKPARTPRLTRSTSA